MAHSLDWNLHNCSTHSTSIDAINESVFLLSRSEQLVGRRWRIALCIQLVRNPLSSKERKVNWKMDRNSSGILSTLNESSFVVAMQLLFKVFRYLMPQTQQYSLINNGFNALQFYLNARALRTFADLPLLHAKNRSILCSTRTVFSVPPPLAFSFILFKLIAITWHSLVCNILTDTRLHNHR